MLDHQLVESTHAITGGSAVIPLEVSLHCDAWYNPTVCAVIHKLASSLEEIHRYSLCVRSNKHDRTDAKCTDSWDNLEGNKLLKFSDKVKPCFSFSFDDYEAQECPTDILFLFLINILTY